MGNSLLGYETCLRIPKRGLRALGPRIREGVRAGSVAAAATLQAPYARHVRMDQNAQKPCAKLMA